MRNFEDIPKRKKKKKIRKKVYINNCKRCGKRFKTSRYGSVCDDCKKKQIIKHRKDGKERCKHILDNGKQCSKGVTFAGYCAQHYWKIRGKN